MGINPEIVDISLPLLVNLNKGGVAMITSPKIVFVFAVLGTITDAPATLINVIHDLNAA